MAAILRLMLILGLVSVSLACANRASAADTFTLQNKWRSEYLGSTGDEAFAHSNTETSGSIWVLQPIGKHRGTQYYRIGTTPNGTPGPCDGDGLHYLNVYLGELKLGPIEKSRRAAHWALEEIEPGLVRIRNRNAKELYLHREEGPIEAGRVEKGWHSAMWLMRDAALCASNNSANTTATATTFSPNPTQGSSAVENQQTNQGTASATTDTPQEGLRIFNQSDSAIWVTRFADDTSGKSETLLEIAAQDAVWVNPQAGSELGFWDNANEQWIGMNYTVSDASKQSITVPYIAPDHVGLTLKNVSSKELEYYSWSGTKDDETVPLGNLPAGQSQTAYVAVDQLLWFSEPEAEGWTGASYKVTASTSQALQVPIKKGDLNADGSISDEEVERLADLAVKSVLKENLKAKEDSAVDSCWKNSYGRGVGVIPAALKPVQCAADRPDYHLGLCYPKCNAGFRGATALCVKDCPAGFRDDGLFCAKPKPVNREIQIWKLGDKAFSLDDAMKRCKASARGKKYGCAMNALNTSVYSNCPDGFHTAPVATGLCTPKCPDGMLDIGVSCEKKSYSRGVGHLPQCGGSTPHFDAGLCYQNCKPGHDAVGPVCWAQCPDKWVNCGAACASSDVACGMRVGSQVLEPLMTAGSIALVAASLGTATGAVAAGQVAKAGAVAAGKVAAKTAAKQAAKQSAKAVLKAKVRAAMKSSAAQGVKAAAKSLAIDAAVGAAITSGIYVYTSETAKKATYDRVIKRTREKLADEITDKQIDAVINQVYAGAEKTDFPYDALDPTGIASIVVAYNIPLCSDLNKKKKK